MMIMKENKNAKNFNGPEKSMEQTPSPAVPNRAHTEMKSEMKSEKTNKKDGSQTTNSKNYK